LLYCLECLRCLNSRNCESYAHTNEQAQHLSGNSHFFV
jgi:hypothetical protein